MKGLTLRPNRAQWQLILNPFSRIRTFFKEYTKAELVYKTILRINIEEEICWQDKGCEERRRQWWKEQWKTNSSGKDYKENTILIKILTMLLRAFLTRTYREDRENPRKGKWDEICHRQFYDWTKICLKTFNVFNLSLIWYVLFYHSPLCHTGKNHKVP